MNLPPFLLPAVEILLAEKNTEVVSGAFAVYGGVCELCGFPRKAEEFFASLRRINWGRFYASPGERQKTMRSVRENKPCLRCLWRYNPTGRTISRTSPRQNREVPENSGLLTF